MEPTLRLMVGALILAVSAVAVGSVGPVRGAQHQPEVVIVGDSLTGGNASYIEPALRSAGIDARVEGLSGRRIAVSHDSRGYRDSGIERIRSLRAAGVDPDLWVVQLGTNDLHVVENCGCSDPIVFAGDLIDRLLAELPSDRPIAWVTVMNRDDYDVTNDFNEALRRRAVINPYLRSIGWARLSLQQPNWFADHVHPNPNGLVHFTQMYIDDIGALLANPPGPTMPTAGMQRAVRLGTPLR